MSDGVIAYQQCIDNVREQISYKSLLSQEVDKKYLDFIVSLIADVYINRNTENTYNINNIRISAERVVKRYSKLDDTHISYVIEKLMQSFKNQQIKNIRKYTISCLYNAPVMIDIDIDSQLTYEGF